MKRTALTGILGIVLLIGSLFLSGLSYSYWNSPANFLLGAGVIYSILGFGLSQTDGEHAIPLWGGSIAAVLFISTRATLPSTSVSVVEALMDKMSFGLGIGAIGTGIIAGVRHSAEKSVKHIILLGGGLFCLSTIAGVLTVPSLTFFPILQLLFFGGIIATALLPYGLLRRKPHPTSPEPE